MIRRLLLARLRRHTSVARMLAGRGPLLFRASIEQPLLWAIGRAPAPPRRLRAVLAIAEPAVRDRDSADVGIGPGMEWRREPGVIAVHDIAEMPSFTGGVQSAGPEVPFEDAITADASVASGETIESPAPTPRHPVSPGADAVSQVPPPAPAMPLSGRAATGVPPEASGWHAREGEMPAPAAPTMLPSPSLATYTLPELPAGDEPLPARDTAELPVAGVGDGPIAAGGPAMPDSVVGPAVVAPAAGLEAPRFATPAAVAEDVAPTAPPRTAALEPATVTETHRPDQSVAHPVTPGVADDAPLEVHPASVGISAPEAPVSAGPPVASTPDSAPAAEVHSGHEMHAATPRETPFDRSPAAWLDRLRGTSAPRPEAVPVEAPDKPASVDHAAMTPEEAGPAQRPSVAPPTVDAAARAWVERQMRGVLEQRTAEARRSPPEPASATPPSPPATPIEMRVARPPRGREPARVAQPGVVRPTVAPSTPPAAQPAVNPPDSIPPVAEQPSGGATLHAGVPADETSREQAEFDRSPAAWMERLRADARRRREREASAAQSSQPVSSQLPPVVEAGAFLAHAPDTGPRQAPGVTLPDAPSVAETARRTGSAAASRPGDARPARFVPPQRGVSPLPEPARRFLRAAVGVDPATVHMVRGPEAGRVTTAYRADAVTRGEHIALAPGEGDTSPEGLGLLAHELTHVARWRNSGVIPPIARPQARAAGLAPAPPGPGVDEEALARTVEAQTIKAARTRFVPPTTHAPRGVSMVTPGAATHAVAHTPVLRDGPVPATMPPDAGRQERIPADEARTRWGNLPAPWEPLPDWLATPPAPVTASVQPTPILAAETPAPVAPQAPEPPVVRAAETARTVPAPERPQHDERQQETAPAPDLDALARQVYAVLKRRLAAERRRLG
ncbi:MAG: DUF4157 domain-containing protein [Chloroflexi bacterium]|nr:DUF4157 domain-containing protein [Chloroflexota bacterium]